MRISVLNLNYLALWNTSKISADNSWNSRRYFRYILALSIRQLKKKTYESFLRASRYKGSLEDCKTRPEVQRVGRWVEVTIIAGTAWRAGRMVYDQNKSRAHHRTENTWTTNSSRCASVSLGSTSVGLGVQL